MVELLIRKGGSGLPLDLGGASPLEYDLGPGQARIAKNDAKFGRNRVMDLFQTVARECSTGQIRSGVLQAGEGLG